MRQSNRVTYAQQVLNAYGSSGGAGGGSTGSTGGTGGGSTGGASGSGGGSGTSPAGCYSSTLGKEMPSNACVQSRSNSLWYQCDDGAWVDRWTDPTACNGTYPL